MPFIIVLVVIWLLLLSLIKANSGDIPSDQSAKINTLFKAHFAPMAKEYAELKGYDRYDALSESAHFGFSSDRYTPYDIIETVKYFDLEAKLTQLKADMKRGCEIYCKEG